MIWHIFEHGSISAVLFIDVLNDLQKEVLTLLKIPLTHYSAEPEITR